MISITKIFHFETAHAIYNYNGACKNIHGHSYQLYVTVKCVNETGNDFIPGQGFVIDFKDLKKQVSEIINEIFDHKMLLSRQFLEAHPELSGFTNLIIWETEPTVENILIFLSQKLKNKFPQNTNLVRLKLFETKDSFAEWESGD
jgi:6-pyruvoyltetrahydropterin/6-carboxytetrahydropterin synthase